MGEFLGRTTAKMVRSFASQSILGKDSREALVKAIAQAAAETACYGVSSGFDGLMEEFDGVEKKPPSRGEKAEKMSVDERTQEERTQKRKGPQTTAPISEESFLENALPALRSKLSEALDNLQEAAQFVGECVQDLKGKVLEGASETYQTLRGAGLSIKKAWDETLNITTENLQNSVKSLF